MAPKYLFLVTALWISATGFSVAAAEPAAPIDSARAEALGRKIDELSTQLGKLDQIVEQLRHLRNEELPQLEKEVRSATENSVLVNKNQQSVQKPATDPAPDGADKQATPPASLETQLAAVHERLQQLDEVSQQIAALRNDDLPRLKNELNRLKTRAKPEQALRPILPLPGQGRVVINNLGNLTRDVTVNGITYTFAPGSWHVAVSAFQDVTTQVTPAEIPHLWGRDHWKVTDSGPEMRLNLR